MITYGGYELIQPTEQLAAAISANFSPMDVAVFRQFKHLRGFEPFSSIASHLSRQVNLNTLYQPWGASRWGTMYGLVDSDSLASIREAAYAGDVYTALALSIDDEDSGTLSTNMFMLPPAPLFDFETDANIQAETSGMYLLTLVDERFFWWERSADISVTERTTTWATLFSSIASALGISLTVDTISANYAYPSRDFARRDHLPMLLDLAASSVGHRVVRKLDGTFRTMSASSALTLVGTQYQSSNVVAGGALSLGVIDSASQKDVIPTVPTSVAVVFPRMNNQTSGTLSHVETVTLASLSLAQYSGVVGHTGTQAFNSTAVAPYVGSLAPVNSEQVAAIAQKLATDFYLWRLAPLDIRYAGCVAWDADGMHDVWWNQTTTFVHRSEWEADFGELRHAGQFGSRFGLQYQETPYIKINSGTLVGGKYDVRVESRNNVTTASDDAASAWGLDLAGSSSLTSSSMYCAVFAGLEASGSTFMAIASGSGNSLSDTSKWIAVVGGTTPSAWSGVTAYVVGNIVSDAGTNYICISGHTNHQPPNATYWVPVTITSRGGYDAGRSYVAGDYVQEVRALHAFTSASGSSSAGSIATGSGTATGPDYTFTGSGVTISAAGSTVTFTVSGGITSINGDPTAAQLLTVGTAGTGFNIDSVTTPGTSVFNLPDANYPSSGTSVAHGLVNQVAQRFGGQKMFDSCVFLDAGTGDPYETPVPNVPMAGDHVYFYAEAGTSGQRSYNVASSLNGGYVGSYTGGSLQNLMLATVFDNGIVNTTAVVCLGVDGSPDKTPVLCLSGTYGVDGSGNPVPYSYPCFAIGVYGSPRLTGIWDTLVDGTVVCGGIVTSKGSGTFVISITGDAGATTGLTITVGGTATVPTLTLGGTLNTTHGGLGANTSAWTSGHAPVANGLGGFSDTVALSPVQGGLGADFSGASAGSIAEANGSGGFVEKKNNYSGGGAPGVNDDVGDGYLPGSIWIG